MEQLKETLDYLLSYMDLDSSDEYYHTIAINLVKQEIERKENKALSLDELKLMIDKPIYDNFYREWQMIIDIIEAEDEFLQADIVLSDYQQVEYHELRFYKYEKE